MSAFVDIMASERNGTLYTGVTGNLVRRVYAHRKSLIKGFTKRYGCKRLVYFEVHDEITSAIQREKQIKRWHREWKLELIEGLNPEWQDLHETIAS